MDRRVLRYDVRSCDDCQKNDHVTRRGSALLSVRCSSDDINNTPKSNRNGIVGMRRGNSAMAAVISARGISEGTNDSDGSSGKECFPSTPSTRTPRIIDATTCKECFPAAHTPRRRQTKLRREQLRKPKSPSRKRGMSNTNMTTVQFHKLTSLAHFVKNNRTERVNLLEIAMAPFEVCYRQHWPPLACSVIICHTGICRPGKKVKNTPCVTLFTVD